MLERYSQLRLVEAGGPLDGPGLIFPAFRDTGASLSAELAPLTVQPGYAHPWPVPAGQPGYREPGGPLMFSGWSEAAGPRIDALVPKAEVGRAADSVDAEVAQARFIPEDTQPASGLVAALEMSSPLALPEEGARSLAAYRTLDIDVLRQAGFKDRYGEDMISDPPGPVDTPPEAFERALDGAVLLSDAHDAWTAHGATPRVAPPATAEPAGELSVESPAGDGLLPSADIWM